MLQYIGDKTIFSQAIADIKKEYANNELFYTESIRWLMSKEELENAIGITSPSKSKNITYATKEHSTYNNPYSIKETVYALENKQLKAYFLYINSFGYTYSNYKNIRDVLVSKYGEPTVENFNWIDEAYKNSPERWDDAFKYSDFTITTIWNNNPNFTLKISWNYDNYCAITYCQKGYENNI